MIRSCAWRMACGSCFKIMSIRSMICRASPSFRSVSCQRCSNSSRCRAACPAMILLSFFISRSTALRARLPSFFRRACVIFMHNWFIRLRNSAGSSIRTFRPRLRISIAAFISVRAASLNNTQSTGKWMCSFTQVVSRKYASRSSASVKSSGCPPLSSQALASARSVSITFLISCSGNHWL